MNNIRNFAIIAHIDHGKSTLADRLIEICGGLDKREMQDQILDSMEIERERGITVKAQAVRLNYQANNGITYQLNLIDTPGHVDFSYEVSRSLMACDGSILVVDAVQGVEAQTLANVYYAIDANHEIIVVLNKIDLPAANPENVKMQIENVIGIDTSRAIEISAKTGYGIKNVLEAIIHQLPSPKIFQDNRLCALLVDSWYDSYLGIVILVRVFSGTLMKGMKIQIVSTKNIYIVDLVGYFQPKRVLCEKICAGEVGFITANIKDISDCKVGDTIIDFRNPTNNILPGFKPSIPVVFCCMFPADSSDFNKLQDSLQKLHLNDSSFSFEITTSAALGFGFRCGFLGLLHLEITQERLDREFNLDIITTVPSVVYNVFLTDKQQISIHNPMEMPDIIKIEKIEEPWITATIIVPEQYLGNVLQLCEDKRGSQKELNFSSNRVIVTYDFPLNEVIFDFYDKLKSVTKGYASFNYELIGNKEGDLVRVSILVNGKSVDAFSMIVHRSKAEKVGRSLCEKLKLLIPKQLFNIAIQAAIGGKIIARETISAYRKDVLAKCYGGDISRKRKLLEKQKAGKKRMRTVGNVEIPQKAFIEALKL